ncbi:phosphatase PAP2 family protein [Butyricicoccus sp.]|uniref:phosphatase PAP2 family protein n=1 Tax=Butyricicoccus sp. TaxID=2049021 RepID=UPI003736C6D4
MAAAITSIDFSLLYWIQVHMRNTFFDSFFKFITHLGDTGVIWIALGIILLCFPKTRRCGICMLACLAVTALLGEGILKHLFTRERPCVQQPIEDMLLAVPSTYSFPSGHSASSFTAATAVFFHYRKAGIAAYILAALIAFSRLYCYVHFPTDVLTGIALGLCVGIVLAPRLSRQLAARSK